MPPTEELERFLRNEVSVSQPIFSAAPFHDRIFVSDVLLYFNTLRRPATYWYTYDPGVTDQALVQQEMVSDLERTSPPYVVVWLAAFQPEPNGRLRDDGATTLDAYLGRHYQLVRKWGDYQLLGRRVPSPQYH